MNAEKGDECDLDGICVRLFFVGSRYADDDDQIQMGQLY